MTLLEVTLAKHAFIAGMALPGTSWALTSWVQQQTTKPDGLSPCLMTATPSPLAERSTTPSQATRASIDGMAVPGNSLAPMLKAKAITTAAATRPPFPLMETPWPRAQSTTPVTEAVHEFLVGTTQPGSK